jgi:hypothetical protein
MKIGAAYTLSSGHVAELGFDDEIGIYLSADLSRHHVVIVPHDGLRGISAAIDLLEKLLVDFKRSDRLH